MYGTHFGPNFKSNWKTIPSYSKFSQNWRKIFLQVPEKYAFFVNFQCFTCIMCNKSLDGVPFTVDASNEIHCIEDFHKRFAPKCSVCRNPIMAQEGQPEVCRVVALDRSFHVYCFKCEDCGLLLSSEAEGKGCYPLDDHVLCKACNTKRIQLLTQDIQ